MAQPESGPETLKRFVIPEDQLPLYQTAGEQSDYGVEVIARAGDAYDIMLLPSIKFAAVSAPGVVFVERIPEETMRFTVDQGDVRIAVIGLGDQQDSSPFMRSAAALIEQSSVR